MQAVWAVLSALPKRQEIARGWVREGCMPFGWLDYTGRQENEASGEHCHVERVQGLCADRDLPKDTGKCLELYLEPT